MADIPYKKTTRSARRGLLPEVSVDLLSAQARLSVATPITFADSPYTILPTDVRLAIDSTGGAIAITLPLALTTPGRQIEFNDAGGDSLANPITVTRSGADLIDGQTNFIIQSNFAYCAVVSNGGTAWNRSGAA